MDDKSITITVRGFCHYCNGTGRILWTKDGGKTTSEKVCPECHGEGVAERQVGLEEFAGMLLPHIAQAIVGEGREVIWSLKDPAGLFEREELKEDDIDGEDGF